jgi:hypothetical protein
VRNPASAAAIRQTHPGIVSPRPSKSIRPHECDRGYKHVAIGGGAEVGGVGGQALGACFLDVDRRTRRIARREGTRGTFLDLVLAIVWRMGGGGYLRGYGVTPNNLADDWDGFKLIFGSP